MDEWTKKNLEKAEQWANMTLSKILREADRDNDDEDRLNSEQIDDVKDCVCILAKCAHLRHMHAGKV